MKVEVDGVTYNVHPFLAEGVDADNPAVAEELRKSIKRIQAGDYEVVADVDD